MHNLIPRSIPQAHTTHSRHDIHTPPSSHCTCTHYTWQVWHVLLLPRSTANPDRHDLHSHISLQHSTGTHNTRQTWHAISYPPTALHRYPQYPILISKFWYLWHDLRLHFDVPSHYRQPFPWNHPHHNPVSFRSQPNEYLSCWTTSVGSQKEIIQQCCRAIIGEYYCNNSCCSFQKRCNLIALKGVSLRKE